MSDPIVIRLSAKALEWLLEQDPEFKVEVTKAALQAATKVYVKHLAVGAIQESGLTQEQVERMLEMAVVESAQEHMAYYGTFQKNRSESWKRWTLILSDNFKEQVRAQVSTAIAELYAEARVLADEKVEEYKAYLKKYVGQELKRAYTNGIESYIRTEVDRRVEQIVELERAQADDSSEK